MCSSGFNLKSLQTISSTAFLWCPSLKHVGSVGQNEAFKRWNRLGYSLATFSNQASGSCSWKKKVIGWLCLSLRTSRLEIFKNDLKILVLLSFVLVGQSSINKFICFVSWRSSVSKIWVNRHFICSSSVITRRTAGLFSVWVPFDPKTGVPNRRFPLVLSYIDLSNYRCW